MYKHTGSKYKYILVHIGRFNKQGKENRAQTVCLLMFWYSCIHIHATYIHTYSHIWEEDNVGGEGVKL